MKKQYFLFSILALLLIVNLGSLSAWTSDNFLEDAQKRVDLDSKTRYGTYEIKKHAWYDPLKIWTEEKIKDVTLNNNTDYCTNCLAEGEIKLYSDDYLMEDVLWKRSFDNGNTWIDWTGFTNWQVYVENKNRYVEQDVFETVCSPTKEISKNGTIVENCEQVKTGTKTVDTGEWEELDFNKKYSADNYKILPAVRR